MGESKYLGPEVVREANEVIAKIRACMIASQDRQQSYVDPKRRHVKFQVEDYVFLYVSPMKGIKRFDPSHILSYETLNVQEYLSYEEKSIKILDKKEKVLRNKMIELVKVLWRNGSVEEAMWELESVMFEQYPELFR
ncbi:uncharacterized protein LOC133815163 [Humulus lupulus]|uniref:uncharacterized protein LOC133815163 n=1 Tax=Humulus lupulus TaxID=3486 RepID=UPI002B40DCB5|nr:uncharacterized protein LOC133815163 [Humulus lupulus]